MLFATASELLANLFAGQRRRMRAVLVFSFLLSLFTLAPAQDAQGQIGRIARISMIEGEISYQRLSDGQSWYDASLNLPLNERDQLYSGPNGRAEIQLSGRNLVRIDRNSNLRFSQFNTGTIQFALPVGTATFRVDSLDRRQFNVVDANDLGKDDPVYFEVDTPIVAITFLKEGNYRVNVREDGTTEVIVRRGQAEVYNKQTGTVTVKQGRRIVVDGNDADFFQISRLEDKDNWDRWNDRRDDDLFSRAENSRSARYVPVAVPGVYDLDSYGDWYESPDYGWVWSPRSVAVGWAPHQVAFFGWGGGYNAGYRDGYRDGRFGWYGWCPLGPRDRYYGGRGNTVIVNNTTIINPRTLDNYNAPGGVSLMEGRRFDNGRVVVNQNDVKAPGEIVLPPAPPRGGGQRSVSSEPTMLRGEEFKPVQAAPTRELKVERAEIARRLESPVIERRPVPSFDRSVTPNRNGEVEIGSRPTRGETPNRGTQSVVSPDRPDRGDRNAPTRNAEPNSAPPTRIQDGQIVRPDRPPRESEYRTVERIPAPSRSLPESERNAPSRDSVNTPRSLPNNNEADRPSRTESPRRYDPPPSRDESPRRNDPPPSRPPVERRESPPPPRESAPSRSERAPERQAPPPRESAPSRPPERPSSPPASRESAPSREVPPARPARPERPDNN